MRVDEGSRTTRGAPIAWAERSAIENRQPRARLHRGCHGQFDACAEVVIHATSTVPRERSVFLVFETDDGRADFHSHRHTFISNLASSGVHPNLAKNLARHSTITLTMDRYSHVGILDMNAALESLPGIPERLGLPEQAVVTGTDQSLVATMVATLPVDGSHSQDLSEANPDTKSARITGRKSLPDEELPPLVTTPDEVRAQGFEPWTYGLKVRCSTN